MTEGSAGYDVFAVGTKTFLPKSVDTLSLELRGAMPTGLYGKLFPGSGILKEHFVSIDADVIDANFRGIIQLLMINHQPEKVFTVCTGDRIAHVVFMEKFNANLHRVSDQHLLGKTKRGNNRFGSTGVIVIKKFKKDDDNDENDENDDKTTSEIQQVIVNSGDNQVTSEEVVMTVNNEVVVHESITIDE